MELLLVRHGLPDYSKDILTEEGRLQAAALAESLRCEQIDEFYVSPMGRAGETAAPTAEIKNMSPVTLPWLHELNGNYDGSSWAWSCPGQEILEKHVNWNVDFWHGFVPYGEQMKKVVKEFGDFFDDFMLEQGYTPEGDRYKITPGNKRKILLVCHAGVIMSLLSKLMHIPLPAAYSHFVIDYASITRIYTDEKDGYAIFKFDSLNEIPYTS